MTRKKTQPYIDKQKYRREMNKIPGVKKIKGRFKQHLENTKYYIAVSLMISFFLIYYLYYLKWDLVNQAFIVIVPGFFFFLFIFTTCFPLFMKKDEIKKVIQPIRGNFTKEELLGIIDEVTAPAKRDNSEIPSFYIHSSLKMPVFMTDIYLLNFLKPLNAVYISENTLTLLNKNELKAVLAHEIGHFRYYMSPVNRILFLIPLAPILVTTAILVLFNLAHSWYGVLLFIIFYRIIRIPLYIPLRNEIKDCEYLSDYYAALKFGKLNVINGLLILNKRLEMISNIYKKVSLRIQGTPDISYKNYLKIMDELIKDAGNSIMTRREINRFIDIYFASDKFIHLKTNLTKQEINARNIKIKQYLTELTGINKIKLIKWSDFDFNIQDYRVDEIEYPYLIKTLIENPRKQLFRLRFDNFYENKIGSHPTMRNRILFLHKNIKE